MHCLIYHHLPDVPSLYILFLDRSALNNRNWDLQWPEHFCHSPHTSSLELRVVYFMCWFIISKQLFLCFLSFPAHFIPEIQWCLWLLQCTREDFVERVKTQQGEGCNVHGFLDVSKVAGNFHFAPGKGFYESNVDVPELSVLEGGFNVSRSCEQFFPLFFGVSIQCF